MASIFIRLLLFVSSYFPLALIFFFLLVSSHRYAAIGILGLGLVGLLGLQLYLSYVQRLAPIKIQVGRLQRKDAEAMSYIVSYIIPFLTIPFTDWKQSASLMVFFIVLGIIYVNSNLIHINPMLNLAGYQLYEVTLNGGGTYSLIARRTVARREIIMVIKVGEDILLEKLNEENK